MMPWRLKAIVNAVASFGQRLSQGARQTYRAWHFGARTAGQYVDENTVYNLSAVMACVRFLTGQVGQLPWQAFYTDPTTGNRTRLTVGPVDRLIHKRPHPEVGSFTFRELMLSRALLHGNAYAEITRNYFGDAVGLHFIEPWRVSLERDAAGALWARVLNEDSGEVMIPYANIFHLRGLGNELEGWSVLHMARKSFGISLASEGVAETAMSNSPRLNLVFTHPSAMSDKSYERLKDDLDERTTPENAHRPIFLEEGMTVEALRLNPADIQLLESRQFQLGEICRWFGVPPHKIGDLARATFSNIESQARESVADSVQPWVLRFEQEADEKLFRPAHKAMGAYTRMNLNALLRADAAGRAALYKALHAMGAISSDDIAELEDLPRVGTENGGDLRFVPLNMQTLSAAKDGRNVKGKTKA